MLISNGCDWICKRLLENDDVKELRIVEGQPLYVGWQKEADKPVVIAGIKFEKVIEYAQYTDFGILDRESCVAISMGFHQDKHCALPDKKASVAVTTKPGFRLIIVDKPASDKMMISYLKPLPPVEAKLSELIEAPVFPNALIRTIHDDGSVFRRLMENSQ